MQVAGKQNKGVFPLKTKTSQCAAELMEVIPLVGRFIGYAMRHRASLSLPQLKVLWFISKNPGTSVSSAAEDLAVTKASASDLIDRLVKRGFVRRVEDPQERRKVLLSLTNEGQNQLDEARQFAQESLLDKLDGAGVAELEKIIAGLQLVKEAFKEG
jgi:DNA-binding MarR family transcriptional regulator